MLCEKSGLFQRRQSICIHFGKQNETVVTYDNLEWRHTQWKEHFRSQKKHRLSACSNFS